MLTPRIWEDGDRIYMVSPVAPLELGAAETEEFAFASKVKAMAPNESILWLRGQYVEADAPNLNGQQWTAGELAIKHLTPMFMPVTVMHDPATAVGLIADVALLTPDSDKVQRARIDTTLAQWSHRFPEVAEECQHNYEQGTLMQSMEAISPWYSCAECGQVFQKLPEGAERANWCDHLKGGPDDKKHGVEGSAAARILGNVTFTGTGLIFGSRGAKGANPSAILDIDQQEVAEFHREQHERKSHTKTRPKLRGTSQVEIDQTKYEELSSRPTRADLDAEKARADQAEEAKSELESKVEALEADKAKAEADLATAKTSLDEAKEESRKTELAEERLSALGKGFVGSLGEFTSKRLREQAKSFSDEEWEARLTEVEEMSGKKRDDKTEGEGKGEGEGKAPEKKDGEFSKEEMAAAQISTTNGDSNGSAPSPAKRRSMVGSLVGSKK